VPITACKSGDGCCPQGCKNSANGGNDNDCVVQPGCGNGLLDTDETCDDTSSTKCLTTCSNGDACSKSVLSGSAQACSLKCMPTQITGCISGDGCCAPGCKNSANGGTDDDCALAAAICGNGIVEPGEGCDGHCPTAADCNDGDVCTDDGIGGDPCHIVCVHRCRTAQLDPLDTAPPGSCTTSRQLVSPMCAPDAGPWQ
jgi:hypothetical protein